jgi:hypothetical protein
MAFLDLSSFFENIFQFSMKRFTVKAFNFFILLFGIYFGCVNGK